MAYHSSKIKDLVIELNNYSFYHGSNALGDEGTYFIGREKIKEELKILLDYSSSDSGAY